MRAMMGVAGVGPKLAERIMAYRVAYGPFRSRTALQGSVATYGAVS
jgi:DNA uptake protein ComE-like DNA-binding protein